MKPSKKAKTPEKTPKWLEQQRAEQASRAAGGTMATAKDRTHEQPSATDVFVGAHAGKARKFASLPELMNQIYTSIFEKGNNPKTVLDSLADEDREEVEGFLLAFYDAGKQSKDLGRAVIQGFRNGQFSSDGDGAFGLVAFLQGADSEAKFNLLNIFGSAKE